MEAKSIKVPHLGRASNATVFVPDGAPGEKFPFVVISHGYNGQGKSHDWMARMFAEAGIGAVTHDFCGGSNADTSGFPTEKMTVDTECEDLNAVIDAVKAMDCADSERLALLGGSMGGLVSAITAARRSDEIRSAGLWYPAFSIPDDWCKTFPDVNDIPETVDFWGMRLGRSFFVTLRELDVWNTLKGFEKPVLIMHGTIDEVVPIAYSKKALSVYRNARLTVYEGEGHGFSPEGAEKRARELLDFLKETL